MSAAQHVSIRRAAPSFVDGTLNDNDFNVHDFLDNLYAREPPSFDHYFYQHHVHYSRWWSQLLPDAVHSLWLQQLQVA